MTRGAARGLAAAFAAVVCALPAWAAEVTEIRVGTHPTFTRVVFQLDAPAGYRIEKVTAEDGVPEIRVTLEAGATPRSLEAKSEMVERVALQDGRERSLAHIRLRQKPSRIKELILTDPPRIVFDLVYPEAKLAEIARREEAAKARAAEVAAAKAAAAAPKPEVKTATAPEAVKPAEPAVVAKPEAPKPELQAKAAPKVEPPKPAPVTPPAPKPMAKPETAAKPPEPKVEAKVAPTPEPKPAVEPKPEVQAKAVPKVEPPKPAPAAEPAPKPVPNPRRPPGRRSPRSTRRSHPSRRRSPGRRAERRPASWCCLPERERAVISETRRMPRKPKSSIRCI